MRIIPMTVVINNSSKAATLIALLWLFLFLLLIAAAIKLSGGNFSYSLDDSYISLSVAENLLSGGYGINRDDFSSPSSSLIYPMLLAPFLAMGFGAYSALIINILAAFTSVWLLTQLFFELIGAAGLRKLYPYVVCFLLIICINSFALPLTGLEHSLHVLLVIVVFRGFLKMTATRSMPSALIIAVILMPFVRFEGMALSAAAIGVMLIYGYKRDAIVCAISVIFGFGLWFAFTRRLGLPFFPSSVLSKQAFLASAVDIDAGSIERMIAAIGWHISESLEYPVGIVFFSAICFLIFRCWPSIAGLRKEKSSTGLMAATVIFSLSAHLLFGRFGWFYRYEVYAVAILLCGGLMIFRDQLAMICNSGNSVQRMCLFAGLLLIGEIYIYATILTPTAMRNIVEQQFQMHRFVTEYFPHNVAVNDIGWVSYNNPNFVLDLVGLASEPVRNARLSHQFNSEFIGNMAEKKQITYAMIYDSWFLDLIPKSWCLVAILKAERIVTGEGTVSFYSLQNSSLKEMSDALDRFAVDLPKRVTLIRSKPSCDSSR